VSNGRTAESQTSPSFTHAARRPGCCSRHFSASRCGWRKSGRALESQSNNAGASSWVKVHARPRKVLSPPRPPIPASRECGCHI
jgi:hypothetical protein